MADLKEKSLALLSTTTGVDLKTAATTSLYTVPAGKVAYISHVVICNTTASLAGGTEYDFGAAAGVTSWKQNVDLSSLTTSGTDYIIIDGNNAKYTEEAAASVFSIKVVTGSTAACTGTVHVFGFLL